MTKKQIRKIFRCVSVLCFCMMVGFIGSIEYNTISIIGGVVGACIFGFGFYVFAKI